MEKITRKTLLYKTKVEYGDYTINHIQGCAHGCTYPCYAMMLSKRFGKSKDYQSWCKPKIVSNALELLDKEIVKYRDDIKSVQLSFMTDPFMVSYPEVEQLSLQIISKLNNSHIKCVVLTKGILPMKLMKTSKKNEFGITIVSLNDDFKKKYEPYTADIKERIGALKKLHEAGFYTWVSMEPYPTPNIVEQNLNEVLKEISFVDKIIFGRMNYNKQVTQCKDYKFFYNKCAEEVINFCALNNKQFHIKNKTISKI